MGARLKDPNFWKMLAAGIVPPLSAATAGTITWEAAAVAIVGALVTGFFGMRQEKLGKPVQSPLEVD